MLWVMQVVKCNMNELTTSPHMLQGGAVGSAIDYLSDHFQQLLAMKKTTGFGTDLIVAQ